MLSADDRQKAQDALERASQAELTASRNNETILEAMELLRKITAELIQDADLDRLEEQLQEASKNLENVNLQQEVSSLKAKQLEQAKKINLYKADIAQLEQEVKNIQQIKDSLPNECYNVVDIEGTRR
ncbi:unnamed protein product [Soboliphyme baturini]|uniref:HOOK domain-containing protein n=1 Tax=Soboliphyme baturini TaxID=241478 RepID=A0A183J8X3_9BILA|nr:unnamed protein product [Soboliphyme baturini]